MGPPDTREQFDVFLSHASEDKDRALEFKARLEACDLTVWLDDHEIPPGSKIPQAVLEAVTRSRFVVLLITRASLDSRWVEMESNAAIYSEGEAGAPILIPCLLEDVPVPVHVRDRRYVDFRDAEEKEESFEKLLWGITGERGPALSDSDHWLTEDRGAPGKRFAVFGGLVAAILIGFLLHAPWKVADPGRWLQWTVIAFLPCMAIFFVGYQVDNYAGAKQLKGTGDWMMRRSFLDNALQWPQMAIGLFDRVFGTQWFSWRRLRRSMMASGLSVVLLTLVFFALDIDDRLLFGPDLGEPMRIVGGFVVCLGIFNLLPDYLSLSQTRWVLGRLNRSRGPWSQLGWILADLVLTFAVFGLVVVLGNPLLSRFMNGVLGRVGGFYWAERSIFEIGIYAPMGGLFQFFVTSLELRELYGVFLYSTFLTSAWLVVFLCASILAWGLFRLRAFLEFCERVFPAAIRDRPHQFASFILISFYALGVLYLVPVWSVATEMIDDEIEESAEQGPVVLCEILPVVQILPGEFDLQAEHYWREGFVATVEKTDPFVVMPVEPARPWNYNMGLEHWGEGSVRIVEIEQPFYMGVTEVTQAQWKSVMAGDSPSRFLGAERPVDGISWEDAQAFVGRLNADWLPSLLKCPGNERFQGLIFRLPTEAEWDYACRAGSAWPLSFAPRKLSSYAWTAHNSGGKTRAVGQKEPNAWGLRDMHGNVWEWCHVSYDPGYYGNRSNPDGEPEAGEYSVLRGGSWEDGAESWHSVSRSYWSPGYRGSNVGFRVVLASPL